MRPFVLLAAALALPVSLPAPAKPPLPLTKRSSSTKPPK